MSRPADAPQRRLVQRLVELAGRLEGARSVRIGGRVLAAALVLLLTVRLVQLWDRHPVDLNRADGGIFVVAVAVSAFAVAAYGLVWTFILRRLGVGASVSWVTIFFKSQLGKYLPGSVWQYAGRVGLVRRRGVSVQTAFASVVVEVAASALAAAAAGSLVLASRRLAPWLVLCVVAAVGLALVVGRLAASQRELLSGREALADGLRSLPAAGVLYVVVWGAYGIAFWTTARSLFDVPAGQLPYYVGTFALGWLAGLVVVFAPGGIGVREAVIVALLGGRLGQAHAIGLAATSRIVLTASDLAFGALAVSMPIHRHRDDAHEAGAPP